MHANLYVEKDLGTMYREKVTLMSSNDHQTYAVHIRFDVRSGYGRSHRSWTVLQVFNQLHVLTILDFWNMEGLGRFCKTRAEPMLMLLL